MANATRVLFNRSGFLRTVALSGVLLALVLTLAWTTPSGAACQPDGGPNSCQPGTSRCLDSKRIQACNPDTCVWDKIAPCNSPNACVSGVCKEGAAEQQSHPGSIPKSTDLTKPKKPSHSCHDGEGFYNERTMYFNPGQSF